MAACLFDDFHNEKKYLERTVELFRDKVGIALRAERRFGGFGNLSLEPQLRQGDRLLVGEAAGLQDALFGFGMRYAIVSGHLAGTAFASGDLDGYPTACRSRLLGLGRAAGVNRYLYERGGDRGYRAKLCKGDARAWLGRYYRGRWWTPLLYPLASRAVARRRQRSDTRECRDDCDCTWCRCMRELADTELAP